MLAKVTSKRQVTFPARVLDALGAKPGDRLLLEETAEGFLLRSPRSDVGCLAPLRPRLRRGVGSFDIHTFREELHDVSLRD